VGKGCAVAAGRLVAGEEAFHFPRLDAPAGRRGAIPAGAPTSKNAPTSMPSSSLEERG